MSGTHSFPLTALRSLASPLTLLVLENHSPEYQRHRRKREPLDRITQVWAIVDRERLQPAGERGRVVSGDWRM